MIIETSFAATIDSSSFDVNPASTSIDTTGSNVSDWGYFLPGADFLDETQPDNTDFDALTAGNGSIDPATNSKASPSIGTVTITERDAAEYSNGGTGFWDFTVNDGIAPVSGTQTAFGAVNGVASGEDIFTITLNDLGAGEHIVTLYMAHTATNRTFRATLALLAADGDAFSGVLATGTGGVVSSAIGGTGGTQYFTYTTVVTTTDPNADLSIAIDSESGSAGQFTFSGYTVLTVPEPSVALLGALGSLMLLRRRRL